jgi:2-methylcitrate dehydratase PrpD
VGLRRGHMGWGDYATELFDPEIRDLMARTSAVHDSEVEAQFPAQVAGRVTVQTRAGQTLSEFVPVPKGEPENPLTPADLRAKFDGLVEAHIGAGRAASLFDWILRLEDQSDLAEYFNLAAT